MMLRNSYFGANARQRLSVREFGAHPVLQPGAILDLQLHLSGERGRAGDQIAEHRESLELGMSTGAFQIPNFPRAANEVYALMFGGRAPSQTTALTAPAGDFRFFVRPLAASR